MFLNFKDTLILKFKKEVEGLEQKSLNESIKTTKVF